MPKYYPRPKTPRAKRPPTNAITALRQSRRDAKEEVRQMSEAEIRARVALSPDEMKTWDKIASGKPVPNASHALQAIKMKLEWGLAKPALRVDSDSKVTVEVVNLAAAQDALPSAKDSP
jgi:hypothetical protein